MFKVCELSDGNYLVVKESEKNLRVISSAVSKEKNKKEEVKITTCTKVETNPTQEI